MPWPLAVALLRSCAPSTCAVGLPRTSNDRPNVTARAGGWSARGQDVGQNWEHMVRVWYDTVGYDPETGKPFPATLEEGSGN